MQVTTQITPRGVDDDTSVIDVTGSDDESEFEDENDHFPAEGMDPEIKIESEDSGDPGVPPQDAGLRRSSRVRTPGEKSIPTMKGQRYDEGVHEGVGFPEAAANNLAAAQEIPSILPPDVYDTVRGVLHLQTNKGEYIFQDIRRRLQSTCYGGSNG